MEEIGFVDSEIKQVLAILAAVLHIGDIVCVISLTFLYFIVSNFRSL